MTALRQCVQEEATPIGRLAALAITRYVQPDTLTERHLAEIFRLRGYLARNGVPEHALLALSRAYARRVDELGPEEFDARMDLQRGAGR